MKSSTQITESRLLGSISAQSILNLLPRSVSKKKHQKMKSIHPSLECDVDRENIPPIDPNVQIDKPLVSPSITPPKKTQLKSVSFQKDSSTVSERQEEEEDKSAAIPPDPAVKVVVRIRPVIWRENGCHATVKKVSPNSLSVADRLFTFDSVFDSSSTQEDLFQLVGVPVVKNSLAGFNTSVLLYGQTGSGKTHTIWGPPSAMVEGHSPSTNQGIGPRIFKMLFSEIQKEQEISGDKQINHQCRCSFLEIYNGHIGDLLDPTQRNLEIRDDAKNGFYVENLTEEYVTNYDDVTQILIKGLANRKVGATSINSKSSRSHIVFSCVVESWCKGTSSSTCFSSSKTSRISLIDLAGSERNKLDDAGRQCVKESRNVKKSLSQLGNLVNVLAEGAQSGKHPRIPYKSSCLTHLLRESIGGNAKLTVICAVSPDEKCNGETLSTLRFGQRAQCIQNEPVINEITENDVNDLSDQIRQLKEELIKTKSTGYNSVGSNSEYFKGRNARESLNQLRISLNRSLILPHIDNDSDEEINVGEEDVTDLCNQLQNSTEENSKDHPSDDKESFHSFEDSSDTELTNECTSRMMACPEENKFEETHWEEPDCELLCRENGGSVASPDTSTTTDRMMACPEENKFEETLWEEPDCKLLCRENGGSVASQDTSTTSDLAFRNSLSVIPCLQSSVLQDPTLSESPKFEKAQKKTVSISLNNLASQNHVSESSKFSSVGLRQSVRRSDHIRASLRSSKVLSGPTESLEASLHRGLQIIDNHQRNSVSNKASVSFSFDHFALKPCQEIEKSDAGVQTLSEEGADLDGQDRSFICATCKRAGNNFSDQAQDNYNTRVVPVDGAGTPKCDQLAEDTQKALAEALKRDEDLENVCAEQIAKIEQLNLLVEEYKLQRGCSPVIGQEHVEPFTDTVEPMKNLKKDEHSSSQEVNHQRLDNENQPDLRENNKLMELQKEMDHDYKSVSFDMSERETLLNEIESLRNRLQYYTDTSSSESQSAQLIKTDADHSLDKAGEELEKERQRWTEMESEWISLTDELRIDIESNRRHAEKLETDLRVEKKVTEELDDALDRSVLGHARIVEHYVELQEKYNELLGRHRSIMGGIAEVKKAAAKAGARGNSSRFVKSLAAELSALRAEKEKERERLKKENRSLKMQLRDTAEAVHAAGELLVRLREAEHAVSVAEENHMSAQKETEKVKKQLEKQKRKHAMEMVTMKQYLADSRLPESALRPLYWQEEDRADGSNTQSTPEDDQSWRAEFGAIYQEHY